MTELYTHKLAEQRLHWVGNYGGVGGGGLKWVTSHSPLIVVGLYVSMLVNVHEGDVMTMHICSLTSKVSECIITRVNLFSSLACTHVHCTAPHIQGRPMADLFLPCTHIIAVVL